MSRLASDIPPLPASWPFAQRSPEASPVLQAAQAIPGEGGEWNLIAAPGLRLEGEAAGMGVAFGRGGVRRIGDVVLRPYRRGGLVRHLNARIYASPGRFAQEFTVHRALWVAGFPTVEPLGYGMRRRGWGFEGFLLTRFTDCEPWPRRWEAAALNPLREDIDALCAWGLYAPDLNATNVMVTREGRVLLLDWDRAQWGSGELLAKYRSRLRRSLEKLRAPSGILAEVDSWRG